MTGRLFARLFQFASFQHLIVNSLVHSLRNEFLHDVLRIVLGLVQGVVSHGTRDHIMGERELYFVLSVIVDRNAIAMQFDFCLVPVLIGECASTVDLCNLEGALPDKIGGGNTKPFSMPEYLRLDGAMRFHN